MSSTNDPLTNLDRSSLTTLAFEIYGFLFRQQPDPSVGTSLVERMKRVRVGLQAEDEFAATIAWLGNCAAINRIDQTPMPIPDPSQKLRASDFVAVPKVNGRLVPALIEVKSDHSDRLDWTESYYNSLVDFAKLLGLPLLVAWKWRELWFLIEHVHFTRNVTAYRLPLEKAFREDLMSLLFRNLRITMNPNLRLKMEVDVLDENVGGTEDLFPKGVYSMQIKSAAFYDGTSEIKDYRPEHFFLFLTAPTEDEFQRVGRRKALLSFRPVSNTSFTLSNVLVTFLALTYKGESVDWHKVLLSEPSDLSGNEYRDSLKAAIDCGFVQYVMDIVPNTPPTFA